jgi:hypothetical protein
MKISKAKRQIMAVTGEAPLTSKEKVLQAYPKAAAKQWSDDGRIVWLVDAFFPDKPSEIGRGDTANQAWKEAAKTLIRCPNWRG